MSLVTTTSVLPDTTRVWVYQASQPFEEEVLPELRAEIHQFVKNWVSHNRRLRAFGDVYHNRFIVLMVDESQADASGCSIDQSVYFLKSLQQKYGVDLFDRMRFSYKDEKGVHTVPRDAFEELYRHGRIDDDTLVFDTLVEQKGQFDRDFLKPLGDSWHRRLVGS
jgi:hypothetical protein